MNNVINNVYKKKINKKNNFYIKFIWFILLLIILIFFKNKSIYIVLVNYQISFLANKYFVKLIKNNHTKIQ